MTHKEWLDNEYSLWIKALQESTVHNFKEHPIVQRMLGEIERIFEYEEIDGCTLALIQQIDHIGYTTELHMISGVGERMIYWAQQVLKQNPKSIVEIGGGVGEFYAILRALGYKGDYFILDLTPVMEFQRKYLDEVEKQTGLNLQFKQATAENWYDYFVSFYAYGEFTDELKNGYIDTLNSIPHGLIVWNPHSGASPEFPSTIHQITIEPTIEEGIKKITW